MTYDRHSRTLEMRACRLAIIATLEHLDMTTAITVAAVSDIAKFSCEQAASRPDILAADADATCEEIERCIVCREADNRGCCEYGRAA